MSLDAGDGRSLGLSWRGVLPEPALSGTTARYADVLTATDLLVESTRTGFEQFLELKDRAAVDATGSVTLTLNAKGIAARQNADRSVEFPDAETGEQVGVLPAQVMWDASVNEKSSSLLAATEHPARRAALGDGLDGWRMRLRSLSPGQPAGLRCPDRRPQDHREDPLVPGRAHQPRRGIRLQRHRAHESESGVVGLRTDVGDGTERRVRAMDGGRVYTLRSTSGGGCHPSDIGMAYKDQDGHGRDSVFAPRTAENAKLDPGRYWTPDGPMAAEHLDAQLQCEEPE
ncbi:hypothetical protein R1T08_03425 [Streptomyces sp. SBC-4]|nr:hypothetical protein [Streptomyces sp. SBC-4]MDV5143372.1 hypothetical protein [Streptomyces sp. SBC-4]